MLLRRHWIYKLMRSRQSAGAQMKLLWGLIIAIISLRPNICVAKKFLGEPLSSEQCTHLFEGVYEFNAYITSDEKICCFCGEGTHWDGDCNDSSPETTQCKVCTHRTYVSYEPHNREQCFPDIKCATPRVPDGGSPSKPSRCVCPAGMKPIGEHFCEADNTAEISEGVEPSRATDTNTDDKNGFDWEEANTLRYDTKPSHRVADRNKLDGIETEPLSALEVGLIVLVASVLVGIVCFITWKIKSKSTASDDVTKEDCEASNSDPSTGIGPMESCAALLPNNSGKLVVEINEETEKSNGATPISRDFPVQFVPENRLEQQPLVPADTMQINPNVGVQNPQRPVLGVTDERIGISERQKKLVHDAVLEISEKIVRNDLNKVGHHLPVPGREIDDFKKANSGDITETATQIFLRCLQLEPQTSLNDLRRHIADYGYLTAIIDRKLELLNNGQA